MGVWAADSRPCRYPSLPLAVTGQARFRNPNSRNFLPGQGPVAREELHRPFRFFAPEFFRLAQGIIPVMGGWGKAVIGEQGGHVGPPLQERGDLPLIRLAWRPATFPQGEGLRADEGTRPYSGFRVKNGGRTVCAPTGYF